MENSFSEAFIMYQIAQILCLGLSKEEVNRAIDIKIPHTKKPSFAKKYSHNTGIKTFKVLYDLGYQEKSELEGLWKIMDKSGFHKAFILNSPNLGIVIKKLEMISSSNGTGMSYDISINNGRIYVYLQYVDTRKDFYSPHAGIAVIAQVIQEYLDIEMMDINLEVGVTQSYLPNESLFSALVTDRVRFNAKQHYISFPLKLWNAQNNRYNSILNSYFEEQYRLLYSVNIKENDDLIHRIYWHMSSTSSDLEKTSNIDIIASKLNMSRSTLYRHLAERNLTFKNLVDELRKNNALKYIKETNMSLGEISDQLGYANLSAFNRAFKRWYNTTPSSLR
ncbi:helix-turn-helix transcriptional regulator [Yersinia enterocolitica]|nr:helix-turn-helix transcriptional regulator [Yersinia enterocolitica]EKN6081422.1 AraC family transcriptional regulator [Yersinia enterocolitica]EKN6153982.1 AraC family transcriptional regulator [Yersinia enterocolitica]